VVEDGHVLRGELVRAGLVDVGELALVDEGGHLALAHDELRAVLDLVLVALEAVGERVVGVVEPLDDVDQFGLQLVPQKPCVLAGVGPCQRGAGSGGRSRY
jgi:hypothetical protein